MKLDFSSERSFQARFAKDLQNLSNTSKISITIHKFRKVDDALPNASLNFISVLPPINNSQTSIRFISKRFLSNLVYSSDRNLLNFWHKKRKCFTSSDPLLHKVQVPSIPGVHFFYSVIERECIRANFKFQ